MKKIIFLFLAVITFEANAQKSKDRIPPVINSVSLDVSSYGLFVNASVSDEIGGSGIWAIYYTVDPKGQTAYNPSRNRHLIGVADFTDADGWDNIIPVDEPNREVLSGPHTLRVTVFDHALNKTDYDVDFIMSF
jgi:hypothetical protein